MHSQRALNVVSTALFAVCLPFPSFNLAFWIVASVMEQFRIQRHTYREVRGLVLLFLGAFRHIEMDSTMECSTLVLKLYLVDAQRSPQPMQAPIRSPTAIFLLLLLNPEFIVRTTRYMYT